MANCKRFCCGPHRLPWWLQILAYLIIVAMLALTIFQMLEFLAGSLGRCSEKPDECKRGTVLRANLEFNSFLIFYYPIIGLILIPFVLLWSPRVAMTSTAVAGLLWVFTLMLLVIHIRIFAYNLRVDSLAGASGSIGLITSTVLLGLNFIMMLITAIVMRTRSSSDHELHINKYEAM